LYRALSAAPQAAMNMWFAGIAAGAVMVVLLAFGDLIVGALWSSAARHPHVVRLCAMVVGGGWQGLTLVPFSSST